MAFFKAFKNLFSGEGKKKAKTYSFIKTGQDPEELWEIVSEIGDGAFGKVYKVSLWPIPTNVVLICTHLFTSQLLTPRSASLEGGVIFG